MKVDANYLQLGVNKIVLLVNDENTKPPVR
jgi:hypothetical protein